MRLSLMRTATVICILCSIVTAQSDDTKPYDSYVLASEWAGSVCLFKDCIVDDTSNQVFNLHGLWPNRNDGNHPFNCLDIPIQINKLPEDLQKLVNKYWSGLYSSQQGFLTHEWTKHGTCWLAAYGDLDKFPDENLKTIVELARTRTTPVPEDYLHLALELSSKTYNLFELLKTQGITPSPNPLRLTKVVTAFATGLGVEKFTVNCSRDEAGRSYLEEIWMCLDKNFLPIDCDRSGTKNCNTYVFYPVKPIAPVSSREVIAL